VHPVDPADPRPDDDAVGPLPDPGHLLVRIARDPDGAVIYAAGVLDEAGGRVLQGAAASLLRTRPAQLQLDLSGVTAADLAGVRALARFRIAVEQSGAELVIRNAHADSYPVDWHTVPHTDKFASYPDGADHDG
jgi:anti-anti-sigma regulatory factor